MNATAPFSERLRWEDKMTLVSQKPPKASVDPQGLLHSKAVERRTGKALVKLSFTVLTMSRGSSNNTLNFYKPLLKAS